MNDEYFGKIPEERLIKENGIIYFKIDGLYRSKLGLPASRATSLCGSYDSRKGCLLSYGVIFRKLLQLMSRTVGRSGGSICW